MCPVWQRLDSVEFFHLPPPQSRSELTPGLRVDYTGFSDTSRAAISMVHDVGGLTVSLEVCLFSHLILPGLLHRTQLNKLPLRKHRAWKQQQHFA